MPITNNNIPALKNGMSDAVLKALDLAGAEAERYAKEIITEMKAVDTGFLRNSITYAIGGHGANTTQYSDDAGVKHGHYSGKAPKDSEGDCVYIGSNVEYAPYVELGTVKMAARPFLKEAVTRHQKDLQSVFEQALKHFSM